MFRHIRSKMIAAFAVPLLLLVAGAGLGAAQVTHLISQEPAPLRTGASHQELVILVLDGAGILAGLLLVLLVSRSVTRPLVDLVRQADELANTVLPATVHAILQAGASSEDPPAVPTVTVKSQDEVAEMARALDAVNRTAVELALGQAEVRHSLAEAFVNLGRRNQNLVTRQLEYLSEIELKEADPDSLEELFRLDHLATRMRRNAESLLILAGSGPARQWAQGVPAMDVARAASAEVEDYKRLRLHHFDAAMVTGAVTTDLVHILAELIENALTFSPPASTVDIYGRFLEGGYVIVIVDSGIGIPAEELATANRRLAGQDEESKVPGRYLGHYVAGKLAARHGISISLQASHSGGVVARVKLPIALIEEPVPDLSAQAELPAAPTGPALGPAALSSPPERQRPENGGGHPDYVPDWADPPAYSAAPGEEATYIPLNGPAAYDLAGLESPASSAGQGGTGARATHGTGEQLDDEPAGPGNPGGYQPAHVLGPDGPPPAFGPGGSQDHRPFWEDQVAAPSAFAGIPDDGFEAEDGRPFGSGQDEAAQEPQSRWDPLAARPDSAPGTVWTAPKIAGPSPLKPPASSLPPTPAQSGPGPSSSPVAPSASPSAPPPVRTPDLGIMSPLAATNAIAGSGRNNAAAGPVPPVVVPADEPPPADPPPITARLPKLSADPAPVDPPSPAATDGHGTSASTAWDILKVPQEPAATVPPLRAPGVLSPAATTASSPTPPSPAGLPGRLSQAVVPPPPAASGGSPASATLRPAAQARSTADGLRKLTRRVPGAALEPEDGSLRRATPTSTARNPLGVTGALSQYLSATSNDGRPDKADNHSRADKAEKEQDAR